MGGYHQLPITPYNPQQPDTMEQFSRAMALKSMLQNAPLQHQALQQQVQAGQLGLEQQQMSMQSQQAMMKAYTEANGNLEQAVPLAAKYGAMPGDVVKLRTAAMEQQKANLDLLQKKGERALQEADWMQGAHDAVAKAPPEQRPQIWQQQVQALAQAGVDVSQVPQQYPGDQAFSILGIGLKGHKQQLEDLAKNADLQKTQAAIPGIEAESKIKQQEAAMTPLQRAKLKQMSSSMYMTMTNQLSPEALDMAANLYATTGQLPAGFARSPQTSAAVIQRAAQLHPGADVAANKASYGADKASLAALQRQRDAVLAFENTAGKNLDLFLKTAQKVVDSGVPWINKPLRSVAIGALGSADLSAYNAARRVAINEIAKVTSNPGLSGQLSDEARREVETFNPQDATLQQTLAVAKVLKQDMANRHQAYDEQLKEIRGRLGASSTSNQPQKSDPLGIR